MVFCCGCLYGGLFFGGGARMINSYGSSSPDGCFHNSLQETVDSTSRYH